jgi:hypothetical protein
VKVLVTALILAAFPSMLMAGACATPTVVPADGRVVDFDFVASSASNFYQFEARSGRSYSVEVRQDYDDVNPDLTVVVSGPSGTCPSPASLAQLTDTSATEPALPANATRVSFTATASGTHKIQVTNGNGSLGRYISVSVSETTIFNVRWSTFAGFITQYGFQNTTSQAISGSLVVTDTLGSSIVPPVTIPVTIAANGEVFKIVGPGFDVNIGGGHGGFAVFTHNGPPGSVLTDAYFIGGNSTVIVPSRFEPVRQRH